QTQHQPAVHPFGLLGPITQKIVNRLSAIKEELSESLSELGAIALALGPATVEPVVKYFAPNETCLLALVQCFVPTDNGSKVLLELIVTGNEHATHITLEQVSSAA
ncbi:hypothetical protein VDS41_13185, partial [Xanthomonas campestris pv. campestris]|nr:hypothetical protein [Xanthomonas campestris pv. campestris]